jgi:hypothetical protein
MYVLVEGAYSFKCIFAEVYIADIYRRILKLYKPTLGF